MIPDDAVIRLVDDLEIIEAEHHDGAALLGRAVCGQRHLDAVLELILVEQARDLIGLIALRHARDDAREQIRRTIAVRTDLTAHAQPDVLALARLDAVLLHLLVDALFLAHRTHCRLVTRPFLRVDQRRPMRIEITDYFTRQVEILHEVGGNHDESLLEIFQEQVLVCRLLQQVKVILDPAEKRTQRDTICSSHHHHPISL